ncbi:MAG: ABC transporter ATP-binding protein [Candidatus Omnitrophica bacterium]|nr:ABC transporter ATP-binding protein [Candidatus Omnitrophota bacterium]
MSTLLEIERLTRRFGGVIALDDVTLSVAEGELVGLIGPNGAGKTTLFNCVTGVLPPTSGGVRFGAQHASLAGMAPHEVAQCGVARTFQNNRLFASLSVLENVMAGAYLRTHAGLWSAALRLPEARREEQWARQRAAQLLEEVGLQERMDEEAVSLPFGLQRRLEIARALASEPSLMLLDEPGAGLNPTEKQQLLQLIGRLKGRGLTVILIEHDMSVVMPVSDRVVVLDDGKVIAVGPPEAVKRDPRVIEAYLGSRSASDAAR